MKSFVVLALAVVLAPAVFAQHQTFAVNPDASEVKMKLNTTHEVVSGIFRVQSGSIDFDRTTSHISGVVIVAAGSGKTGNDSRDKKMNKDILKVDTIRHPSLSHPKTYNGMIAASGDSEGYSGERSVHAARHSSRSNDSDADSCGWNEGNGESAIRRSLCAVGSQEPELPDLEGGRMM